MYSIKTDTFCLELTPIADTITIKVSSYDFSAVACIDSDEALTAGFALQINELYENLKGVARLQDLYETDSFIEFTALDLGHIAVRGQIISLRNRQTQQLEFENSFDQTYLRDFAKKLLLDFGRYAE